MNLLVKLNLVLILVFSAALTLVGYFSYQLMVKNAREEVIQNARVMMQAAYSMRSYTIKQVRPLLNEIPAKMAGVKFYPQSVPAYAATEAFENLRVSFPEYSYKEAALNPTNPRDRATDWETDLISAFRDHPGNKEIIGDRDTPTGRSLFLSHPIQITNPACLECHNTPAEAPKAMLKLYGDSSGFGWKQDEVVGAQIVSVPMSTAIENAAKVWHNLMLLLAAVFAGILLLLNIMLGSMVVRPVKNMAKFADSVSKGNLDEPELVVSGSGEIATLADAFNRMSRSVREAMRLLDV